MTFKRIASLVACFVLSISMSALAETKSNQSDFVLGITEVTAQKRLENVQDIPIGMSVFSEDFINDTGVKDIKELTFYTPNLYPKQSTNQNMLIMRGLFSHSLALSTPVGLFVDNISYPLTFMQNPDLVDIERVEVLRGPQGTLYGRNTEAGAVNIITKEPGNELRGRVFIEPSFYDARDKAIFSIKTGANVSGPILKDKLFFGGSVQYENSDGYTKNVFDGDDKAAKIDHKNIQGKVRFTPNKKLSISILANAFKRDDGYGYTRYISGPAKSDRHEVNWDGGNSWEDKNDGQALKISYLADKYTLESITTRNNFITDFINDGEFGSTPMPDQVWGFKDKSYTQEFRISSPDGDSNLSWIAGVYGFTEDVEAHAEFFGFKILTDYDSKGYAAFGQATYTFMKRLHLTAGLRYDHQESEGDQESTMVNAKYGADVDHNEWLPKVSVSYDIDKSFMVYSTIAKGILAGGYDYGFATNSATLTYKPEFSWNYEAGFKSSWLKDKVMLNASVFYIEVKDKQVEDFLNGSPMRKVSNAAEASSKGFEVEFKAYPADGWQIFSGIGYTKVEFEKWIMKQPDGSVYNFKGNKIPLAPEYNFNVGTQYNHESGFFGRVDMTGVGDFYSDTKNTSKLKGYETVNLKLGFEKKNFQVSLWCKNLFDKEYLVNRSYYIGGFTAQDGAPRTVGTTLSYKF